MTIYVGFQRINEDYRREEEAMIRSTGKTRRQLREETGVRAKTLALRENLPQGCRLIGRYAAAPQTFSPSDPAYLAFFPTIMIVETDDPAHIAWIIAHYAGYFTFAFHPYYEY